MCVSIHLYISKEHRGKEAIQNSSSEFKLFSFFQKISGNIDRARTHTTHTLHKQTDISYYKYPQRLDTDAYKCSADAVAGCWVVILKKN